MAQALNEIGLNGVTFRPTTFRPTFQKYRQETCGGVQIHVTDRGCFQPVRTSLAILQLAREFSGNQFQWRTETYEFVSDRLAIDLLFGSDRERKELEEGKDSREIAKTWEKEEADFWELRKKYLFYRE